MSERRGTLFLAVAAAVTVVLSATMAVDAGGTGFPRFLKTLGGPGHAAVYPGGVEIAPDGGIVVADTGNSQVVKYSPTGGLVWRVGTPGSGTGQFLDPRDVGIDSASGKIFVADNSNGRIVVLDAAGNWLSTFTGPTGDHMGAPIGVSSSGGKVYVADGVQSKVRVFDTSGNQLLAVASSGICILSRARDAAADAEGNIYVAGYEKDDIVKFSSTGACITTWGHKGTGIGQFKNPYGVTVAVDPILRKEAVFVADSNNERIEEFLTDGTYEAQLGSSGTTPGTFTQLRRVAVATNGSGDVWGADLWGYRLERFHRSAAGYAYVQTIGGIPPPLTSAHDFNKPHGIAFDGAGNLEVVDTVNQRLIHLSPMGAILGACGQRGFQAGQDNWPRGVAVDQATGQIWIADTKQSNLQIINPDCSAVAQLGVSGSGLSQFNWPFSIAIRQSDRIAWVADTLNNRIVSYDVATHAPIAAFGSLGSGSGQFHKPAGIAVAPVSGHILVADELNNRVVELSDSGGGSITVVRTLTDSLLTPQGVAADENGHIYIADSGNSRVVVLNPDGSQLAVMTNVKQPENLAVDADGKLYVADTYNDRIQVYS